MDDTNYAKKFNSIWWKKARDTFQKELSERQTFSRQYAALQEPDDWMAAKEYKFQLDQWRPYLYDAINHYLGQPYTLEKYSDSELEKIITQLNQAIN